MMTSNPLFIQDTDLARAWARAFLEAMKPGRLEILPLAVTVTGFADDWPTENPAIRCALDEALLKMDEFYCDTVASTIFPQSLWNPEKSRDQLFERYRRVLPRLRKMEKRNRYGLYFERLIAFGPQKINQLDHIISTYQGGNHRRSSLQASIFDPAVDHTNQRQRGFPCMQQIAFAPYGDGELAITGFYAIQHLFERAYGNYLGLCNLGRFVAHELGLRLTQMTCVAGVAKLGNVNKAELRELLRKLEDIG
jgi:thymidylate synthase